jgi:hypothetical protein
MTQEEECMTSYRVVCLDTEQTCAVFTGESTDRRLAMAMAYRLAKQAEAGERLSFKARDRRPPQAPRGTPARRWR